MMYKKIAVCFLIMKICASCIAGVPYNFLSFSSLTFLTWELLYGDHNSNLAIFLIGYFLFHLFVLVTVFYALSHRRIFMAINSFVLFCVLVSDIIMFNVVYGYNHPNFSIFASLLDLLCIVLLVLSSVKKEGSSINKNISDDVIT